MKKQLALKLMGFLSLFCMNKAMSADCEKKSCCPVRIDIYQNKDVEEFVTTMNDWNVIYFKSYPYLYSPFPEEPLPTIHSIYVKDQNGTVIIGRNKGKIESILATIPLSSSYLNIENFPRNIAEEAAEKGFNPDDILYVGFFLLSDDFRQNERFILGMYNKLVDTAKKMGKHAICYMDIVREEDHPLKPVNYIPTEPWGTSITGFKKMGITLDISWPTIQPNGTVEDSVNTLEFYIKEID